MQFFSDEPKFYSILIFPLGVFLFGNSDIIHLIALSSFCLLFSSGIYFKNYCNMATLLILFPLLIFQNLYAVQLILQKKATHLLWQMQKQIISQTQFWTNLIEAVAICCISYFAFRKYWSYRQYFVQN